VAWDLGEAKRVGAESGCMSMIHWYLPWKIEAGNLGEELAKGYHGQVHQTMKSGRHAQPDTTIG
jgi:hypothetical protein